MKLFEVDRKNPGNFSSNTTVAWIWAASEIQAIEKFEGYFGRKLDYTEAIKERENWELELPPIIN